MGYVECPECGGDGEVLVQDEDGNVQDDVETCPLCDGEGAITEREYQEWAKEMRSNP